MLFQHFSKSRLSALLCLTLFTSCDSAEKFVPLVDTEWILVRYENLEGETIYTPDNEGDRIVFLTDGIYQIRYFEKWITSGKYEYLDGLVELTFHFGCPEVGSNYCSIFGPLPTDIKFRHNRLEMTFIGIYDHHFTGVLVHEPSNS